jgi:hypothetical protein
MKVQAFKLIGCSLILAFLLSPMICIGQEIEQDPDWKKNELSINLIYLSGGYTSISYERSVSQYISLGLDVGATLYRFDFDINYTLAPYIRINFPTRKRNMFFIELNYGLVNYTEESFDRDLRQTLMIERRAMGPGTAIGWKITNKKEYSLNLVVGALANNNNEGFEFEDIIPRFGIYLGKRF